MSADLVTIAPGHQLAPAPATAYLRALAAGCPAGITSSYRDPQRQARMRADYLAARARGEKVAFVAAVEDSEHVTGYALDLPAAPRAWMRAHPEYGFVFTDPTEAWHVAYRAARDQHLTDGITAPTPLTRTTEEDDDMKAIIATYPGSTGIFLLTPSTKLHLHSTAELDVWKAAGAIENNSIPAATIDALPWAAGTPCHDIWKK